MGVHVSGCTCCTQCVSTLTHTPIHIHPPTHLYTQEGGHHNVEEFEPRGKEPEDEVQMYTWMDATLRELTDLVKEVQSAARNPRARLQFALIYPDRQGKNVLKPVCGALVGLKKAEAHASYTHHYNTQVGSVHASRHGPDDLKTLKTLGFQVCVW